LTVSSASQMGSHYVTQAVHTFLFLFSLFSSCCFLPRSGRRNSPSPPPSEEKDHLEVWAPVVDSEVPSLESPTLPPLSSPLCCDFGRPNEGTSTLQSVRRAVGGDHAVPLDPGQLETVLEK
uniref:Sorting nexin 11 n=1 Tax=Macaca nemestrina TaxID=9545 RepID=A0A2K6CFT7_MACNE